MPWCWLCHCRLTTPQTYLVWLFALFSARLTTVLVVIASLLCRGCFVSMGLIYKVTNFLVNTNVCILLYFAWLILFFKVIYFHHAVPYAHVNVDLAWCLRQRRSYAALARVQSRGFMPRQRLQSGGRVSVEQKWRTTGKKNPARQPGIISKWGGIATRLIPAPDVSIVQSVGLENPARWPGWRN